MQYKLGKLAVKKDVRTLQFAKYVRTMHLPPTPSSCDWTAGVTDWRMMLNDQEGCCTCSGAGHMEMVWTLNTTGTPFVPSDSDIQKAYCDVSGFDPNTGANDNGAVEVDVLNYWRKVGIGGKKIQAYVSVNPRDHNHLALSTYLFGGVYTGIALPLTAQDQLSQGQPWDAGWSHWGKSKPGSWGGHCVPVVKYDSDYLYCITWGKIQPMTWRFWDQYGDESYGILSPDWISDTVQNPTGFDFATLQADLGAVAA